MPKELTNGTVPSQSPGHRCEFKAYHETIQDGIPKSEHVLEPFAEYHNHSEDSTYALVIKRTFKDGSKKTSLTVNSPHILKAFRDVIRSYDPVVSDFTSSLSLEAPFTMLVHYWDELDEYRKALCDTDGRKHLDLLFEFMDRELSSDRSRALKMIQKGQVSFQDAWVIYRPGDILYQEFMGEPWLLVCKKAVYEQHHEDGPYLEIHAVYTDDNGTTVGEATQTKRLLQRLIFPQGSAVPITGLAIYPRKFAPAGDSLERRLKARGEKFLALKDRSTVRYDGLAEYLKPPPFEFYDPSDCKFRGVWLPYTETGRVILDRKTFGEEQRMSHIKVKVAEPKPWLCPPYTIGYAPSQKRWVRLQIQNIHDAGWAPNSWDTLVLPEKEKRFLRSLVTSTNRNRKARDLSSCCTVLQARAKHLRPRLPPKLLRKPCLLRR